MRRPADRSLSRHTANRRRQRTGLASIAVTVGKDPAAMNRPEVSWEIQCPDKTGFATSASSLFEAAANALDWCEVESRVFGTDRVFADDEVLEIEADTSKGRIHRMEVGEVRAWMERRNATEDRSDSDCRSPQKTPNR